MIEKLMKGRSSKRIRERYINHLDPDVKKEPWTIEEDILLIFLQLKYKNKWSLIRQFIKGRPDTHIKNRYNSFISKVYDLEVIEKNGG